MIEYANLGAKYSDKEISLGEDNYKGMALFNAFNDYIKLNNFKCEYTTTKFGLDVKNLKESIKKNVKFYRI